MTIDECSVRPLTRSSHGYLRFAANLTRHYGSRLAGVFVFGSRARGDHYADSDVDVAVILEGPLDFWHEHRILSDLSYEHLVRDGVDIQAWPVSSEAWSDPDRHANPSLIRAMKRDGKAVHQR